MFCRNNRRIDCSIRFSVVGVRWNLDGIGADIYIWIPKRQRWLTVKSDSSYLSSSDCRVTFGVGPQRHIKRVVVEWPSGLRQELGMLEADRTYAIEDGKGTIEDIPFQGSA